MKTAVINIKTEPDLKKEIQQVASDMGLSLSVLVNNYFRKVVRTKRVTFDVRDEVPNEKTIKALRESEEELRTGNVSPNFDEVDDAIAWLEDSNRKYANQI